MIPDESKTLMRHEANLLLSRLHERGFVLYDKISPALELSLKDYLGLISTRTAQPSNGYRQMLLESIRDFLAGNGHENADSLCAEFSEAPLIQHADHSALLLEQETFLNNFLLAIGHRDAGRKTMFANQCSTVSCLSRRDPVAGPTFLRTNGCLYNVFSFSKRTLKDSSFCSLPTPVEFTFQKLEGVPLLAEPPPLLRVLERQTYASAPDAYLAANEYVWQNIRNFTGVRRIGLDERVACDLAARHITGKSGPYYNLLFDARLRDTFLNVKADFIASNKNRAIGRSAPDFFWYSHQGRLYPLKMSYKQGRPFLVYNGGATDIAMEVSPESIAGGLSAGELYVDMFTSYLLKCVLPGVPAIGGTSQQDYLSHYADIMLETNRICPFLDEKDVRAMYNSDVSRFGGAALLELDPGETQFIQTLDKGSDLEGFFSVFLKKKVAETIGSFQCASYLLNEKE